MKSNLDNIGNVKLETIIGLSSGFLLFMWGMGLLRRDVFEVLAIYGGIGLIIGSIIYLKKKI